MGKAVLGLAMVLSVAMASQIAAAAGDPQRGQEKAAACMACHGVDGNSPALPPEVEQWPKLAGQLPEYMTKQIHDFKSGRRVNEQMTPQAQSLADADIDDISAYFSAQQPQPEVVTDQALLALGEKLFHKGKGAPNQVTACIGCHGPNGIGQVDWVRFYSQPPTVLAPAVTGQHSSYIAKQLTMFRDGSRSNDVGKVMRDIASRLDARDIEALAAYIASLGR